jgi:ATP-dependent helicase/nuclease subunit A
MTRSALLSKDVICPGEWVLMTALRRTEAGALFELGGRPMETCLGDPVWKIGVVREDTTGGGTNICDVTAEVLPDGTVERLRQGLAFRYGHERAAVAPSKQTATQRKGRQKDTEVAEHAHERTFTARKWRRPGFVEQTMDGVRRGNAYHAVMQYIRFECCEDEPGIRREMERLEREGFLTAEQVRAVDTAQIAAFFASELGQLVRCSKEVLREFKFSILDDGENFDPALVGEKILMQGVVDCAVVDDDGLIIIDFKTDHVTEETLTQRVEDYRSQVETYRDAMERIFCKKVKRAVLYFFSMDRFSEIK